jgi:hypothetical protein
MHLDFARLGKQAALGLRQPLHDPLIETSLQKVDQRSDRL